MTGSPPRPRPPHAPSPLGRQLDLLSAGSAPAPAWSSFTLLTWNLLFTRWIRPAWYPDCAPEDLEPRRRHPRLLAALREQQSDAMALQEVDTELIPSLALAFPDHQLLELRYHEAGMVVLVRCGGARLEVLELEPGQKRAALVTLPGGLRLAVVHLSWADPQQVERRPGLAQLERVLAAEPDLLCGDLNSHPEWPERRRALAWGLIDHSPPGPSCNVKRRLEPLDVILARPGLEVRAEPLARIERGTVMPSPAFPSDHLPMRARIHCPPNLAARVPAGGGPR